MSEFVLNAVSWIAGILPDSMKQSLYSMGPISNLVRGGLNRLAPEGKTTVATCFPEQ